MTNMKVTMYYSLLGSPYPHLGMPRSLTASLTTFLLTAHVRIITDKSLQLCFMKAGIDFFFLCETMNLVWPELRSLKTLRGCIRLLRMTAVPWVLTVSGHTGGEGRGIPLVCWLLILNSFPKGSFSDLLLNRQLGSFLIPCPVCKSI